MTAAMAQAAKQVASGLIAVTRPRIRSASAEIAATEVSVVRFIGSSETVSGRPGGCQAAAATATAPASQTVASDPPGE